MASPDSPAQILAAMRHTQCDCTIEVHAPGGLVVTSLVAHKAILSRATYFASLFEHNDPARIERRDADGRRVVRSVYVVEVPFTAQSLHAVIDGLYDVAVFDRADRYGGDPIDMIAAVLYLGVPNRHVNRLVEGALGALLDDLSVTSKADKGIPRESAGADQLVSFVRHMLASDIEAMTKVNLLARVAYIFSTEERKAIAAECPEWVPTRYYRPEAVIGRVQTDPDGRRWRILRVAFDRAGIAHEHAARIDWQGLRFEARSRFVPIEGLDGCEKTDCENGLLVVYVACAPSGETLRQRRENENVPNGHVDARRRAVSYSARVYHPVHGVLTRGLAGWAHDTPMSSDPLTHREYYRATGRSVPRGATVVPDPLDWKTHRAGQDGRRVPNRIQFFDYRPRGPTSNNLLACEVNICVEEVPESRSVGTVGILFS